MSDGISGLQLTTSNLLQFGAFISPFLLGFFLIMSSIFNQDLKGVIYLAGVLISTIINLFLLNIIRHQQPVDVDPICSILSFNIFSKGGTFDIPNLSSSFIAFTMAYLLLPMFYNNQMNYAVLTFLIVFFIIDSVTKYINKCTPMGGIFVGSLIGFLLGSIWFGLFYSSGNNDLLYFNEFISNNVVCNRPTKQTFKCAVYKNGELIKSNIV